jgi:BirA family transcriptional regulator, biotin operon repressor / biotin---[acetyl-CoA-carboxylase] ligase
MNPSEEWQLTTAHIGKRVLVFDRLDSTNALALTLAGDTANDGLVVLAEEQTAGRGQHGRAWSCPAGHGVLMSVLLFPPALLRRPALLTAWAAVSVCRTIQKMTGLQPQIKWPNDVMIQGRKVCGILIEQKRGTVAGIGLNVNQSADHFAALGLPHVASLAVFSGQNQDCRDVARQLIFELDAQYQRLCQGDLETLQTSWKLLLGLVGKQVEVESPTARHSGLLQDITFEGLALHLADGTPLYLPPEGVRHLRESTC